MLAAKIDDIEQLRGPRPERMRLPVDVCCEGPLFGEQIKVRTHAMLPTGGENGASTENKGVQGHDPVERAC